MARLRKMLWRIIRKIVLYFFIITIGLTILYSFLPIPFTPLMIIRTVEQMVEGDGVRWKYSWRSYKNISPALPMAVYCAEDQNFLTHSGFDIKAIKKAIKNNEKGRKLRGGSTISQQTAKNVFLWPGRTWVRKGLEAYFTVLIEIFWTKKRIMTVYVNVIEMGDGVYGAQAAARYYWKKDAKNLTREQAASLAAILPNPSKYKAVNSGPYVNRRKRWIMRQMGYNGYELNFKAPKEEKK